MKKVITLATAIIASSLSLYAQETLSKDPIQLDEIIVSSTRVGKKSAVAYSNLSEEQIKKDNAAKNIPLILQTLPSVVAFSEDGLGVGNTQYRIRGTDANRINVTLNGMPVNNPESQEVYWVNLPDLSNSLKSIQVQRGVGTSTNGSASFGGSISLQTIGSKAQVYGEASTAIGSYGTFLSTVAAGTGITKSGLSLDGRYSRVTGNGYVRNGKVDHKNANVSLSHYTDNQLIRINYINGIQHTGITWEGIDPGMLDIDRRYNSAGEYKDDAGNIHYYDNETDNYYSNIVQGIFSRNLSNKLTLNVNLSYNSGYGYYENYKKNQNLKDKFGVQPQVIEGITYKKSDIIRRKSMSNNLYVGIVNMNYHTDRLKLDAGGMYSYYDGSHYGRLQWVKYNKDIPKNYEWYRNDASKRDMNLFVKGEYDILNGDNQLTATAEAQYRYVDYRMEGMDDDSVDMTQNNYYSFFNPKFGLSYSFAQRNKVFFSLGIANREPLRADLQNYKKSNQTMKSERLFDYELGYNYVSSNFSFDANLYYMGYKDQLVLTGKLSDIGYKLQENAPKSYRTGIELAASYTPIKWLRLDANTTLSRNKIKNYTVYYNTLVDPNWAQAPSQVSEYIGNTDISFSPNIVGSGIITVMPYKSLSLSLMNKYVGKMYYDNTSNSENQLSGYYIANFTAGYTFNTQKIGQIDVQFTVNNIFSKKYVANAWVDTNKFLDGSPDQVYKGVFPQAPRNIMARVGIRF